MKRKIYNIENLKIIFHSNDSFIKAVEGISLHINEGESVAIVGESGCGKSVTALSMMHLLSFGSFMRADKMEYLYNDEYIDIQNLSNDELLNIRGNEISMVFQDPNSSLNPVMTVGEQISETIIAHKKVSKEEAKKQAIQLLKSVGIADSEKRYNSYPHELSGGQKQRVLIAIATSCNPKLILADEPTTALDVTVQKQILDLITDLRKENNTALLLITHDLGVVRNYSDRIYVMYCGKIVEEGNTLDILNNPMHPYTIGLLETIPSISQKQKRFIQIPKNVPSPMNKPSGCYFKDRCKYASKICDNNPPLVKVDNRCVRCWRVLDNE